MSLTLKDKFMNGFVDLLSVNPTIGRFLIKVLGIKLKHRNNLILQRYLQAKENGEDITTLPKADGLLRRIQLGNLKILKEFDAFCKKNGFTYWLTYGTQLGATRHKGYIPWDDDIDVGMMRDEYEKLHEVFNKLNTNPLLTLEMIKNKHVPCMLMMKIRHKELPFIFIDVFPWDYYHSALNDEERKIANAKVLEARQNVSKEKFLLKMKNDDLYKYAKDYTKTHILENKPVDETIRPDIFMGLEFPHAGKVQIMKYDDIFPISDAEFEGYKMMQMNNPRVHLENWYGNYMDYPGKMFLGHFQHQIISPKESVILDRFIEGMEA